MCILRGVPLRWTQLMRCAMNRLCFLLLMPALLCAAIPRDTLRLGLEDAIQLALRDHRDSELARISHREAELDYADVLARMLPQLTAGAVVPSISDSRSQLWNDAEERYYWRNVNRQYKEGSLQLESELPLGTSVSAGMSTYHTESSTGDYDEEYGTNWSLGLSYSLLAARTPWGDYRQGRRQYTLEHLGASEQMATLRYRVIQAYYSLLRAQMRHALAREDLQAAENNLERARSRYEAGLIAESDYLKIDLEKLEQEASFLSDSSSLVLQTRTFAELVRVDPERPVMLNQELDSTVQTHRLDELQQTLAANNLGFLEAQDAVQDRQREVRNRLRDLFPDFTLRLGWDLYKTGDEIDLELADLGLSRSVSLSMSYPLYTGGSTARSLERARLSLRRSQLAREELQEELGDQLRSLLADLDELQRTLPIRRRMVQMAERDYLISVERHEAGQITSQALIDAGRALSQARLDMLNNHINLLLSEAQLERLLGVDRERLEQEL